VIEGRAAVAGNFHGAVIAAGFAELFEAQHGALAAHVDDKIARDGEEPGVKARVAVELIAAQEHAHPGLLKEVFGLLAVAGEVEQVTQQAVLVAQDERVEQLRVVALEPLGHGGVFTLGLGCELDGGGAHLNV